MCHSHCHSPFLPVGPTPNSQSAVLWLMTNFSTKSCASLWIHLEVLQTTPTATPPFSRLKTTLETKWMFTKDRKVWVTGLLSVPYLVPLRLQLSHLVLDHCVLLLVHVTVEGQLLHLEAQALLLIQELNTNTHTHTHITPVCFRDIL